MSKKFETDIYSDLLREVTKKDRRNLYLASSSGLLISKGGFVPSEFTTLGIKFSETNQEFFVVALGVVVLYFMLSFFLNAITDIAKMKLEGWQNSLESIVSESKEIDSTRFDEAVRFMGNLEWVKWPVVIIKIFRIAFDFVLPLIVSIYAAVSIF